MKTRQIWSDKVQDISGSTQPIYDVIFTTDGSKLIATAGSEILIYNAQDGSLIKALKAHKESVICLCPLIGDGFASGGADKQVVIWSDALQGILKYTHGDTIQSISQNPVSGIVLTCTASDFGLWTPDIKAVPKTKVPSRIVSSSWTPDGQQFALGLYNGHISIRSSSGEEQVRIERGASPVWTLSWCTLQGLENNVLAVADWAQRLSFFESTGRQVGKDRQLGYDPCSVSHFGSGEYMIMGGSNKQVHLWTSEGVQIDQICKTEGWIWSCKTRPGSPYLAVGSDDGTISVHQVTFDTVDAVFGEKYAYRQNLTDVVIQNLTTKQECRIKCRNYIKKIAIYKDVLVVQLPERLFIYDLVMDELGEMQYRIRDKIQNTLECQYLIAISDNIAYSNQNRLEMISFVGDKQHDWNFSGSIRFAKAVGGPRGRECILVGLHDGSVYKVFVNNPFPVLLLKHTVPIKNLDVNQTKKKLALIDDEDTLAVYDLVTQQIIYQEPKAVSIAWNNEIEDALAYSSGTSLFVKMDNFAAIQQPVQGSVIGFAGARVHCLYENKPIAIDIPQNNTFDAYIEQGNFEGAYRTACLGLSEADWVKLGKSALEQLQLDISKKAFVRIRNHKYMEALRVLSKMKQDGKKENDLFLAEVAAYCGKFYDAARLFQRSGHTQKAIEMYTELNLWEAAQQLVESCNESPTEILKKKAEIQADRKDVLAAASTFEEVGEFTKVVELLGNQGYIDQLYDFVQRKLTGNDKELLSNCIDYFKKHNQLNYAIEAVKKLGDISALLSIFVDMQRWEEAFKIADTHPEFREQIYLPYGNWLAINDRFDEAQAYYTKAGRPDESIRILKFLVENSVHQYRFKLAGYYYWCLGKETLTLVTKRATISQRTNKGNPQADWKHYKKLSEVYYAYNLIYKFIEDPFTLSPPESLMNAAKFVLVYVLNNPCPPQISKVYTLYCLAKIGYQLGCFKTSRFAYEKLLQMRLPPKWQDQVEHAALSTRAKPNQDPEEYRTVCFQCSYVHPFMNTRESSCPNCLEPYVHSFYSFGNLPMIRFIPNPEISEKEAIELLKTDPPVDTYFSRSTQEIMKLAELERTGKGIYTPVVFNKQKLLECEVHKVFIRRWPSVEPEYYLLVSDDVHVVKCDSCQLFFEEGEWNYQVLLLSCCPFCKNPSQVVS